MRNVAGWIHREGRQRPQSRGAYRARDRTAVDEKDTARNTGSDRASNPTPGGAVSTDKIYRPGPLGNPCVILGSQGGSIPSHRRAARKGCAMQIDDVNFQLCIETPRATICLSAITREKSAEIA